MAIDTTELIHPTLLPTTSLVNESHPIGQKWVKLGGLTGVGAPTTPLQPILKGQYQTFEKGVIIYSADWGAVLVSLKLFQQWQSLHSRTSETGQNLLEYVSYPTRDYSITPGLETAYFERGTMFVKTAIAQAFLISGSINEHYYGVRGIVGLPIGEATNAAGGGYYQAFESDFVSCS